MKPEEDYIDVEPIWDQIIVCPNCGQKNRIPGGLDIRLRCGSCKSEFQGCAPRQEPGSSTGNRILLNILERIRWNLSVYKTEYIRGCIIAFVCATVCLFVVTYVSPSEQVTLKPIQKDPSSIPYQATPPPEDNSSLATNAVPDSKGNRSANQASAVEIVRPLYVRSSTAPNGAPWPTSASYVAGYPHLRTGGLSDVTVDNSRNGSDVFVKLVAIEKPKAYPVRFFYVPAYKSFTVKNILVGKYDVRYQDLASGVRLRTEPFVLTQSQTQASDVTMTLYKVPNGNMHTYEISDDEF